MHTYAARARRAAWLLPIGLLVATFPLVSSPTSVAFGATTPISLSLGFSPSALYPVSDGVPVYTVGDTIWALSSYNYSVPISVTSAPAGSSATAHTVATTLLGREVITALYNFTANDPNGVWNITLGTTRGLVVIPVHFVNLAANPVSLGPLAYSIDGGNLLISTTANLGDSYDQEVCAAGNDTSAGLTLGLPTAMGATGNVTLTPGTPFGVTVAGMTEPFSFWFELYHPYPLDIMNSNNVVSENLTVADSRAIAFSTNGTANATLAWNLPVHQGQYEVRAFFQDSTSLQVVQSSVLILNDSSWVSLGSSCPPQVVQSSDISYSASLTGGESSWPSTLYVMYQTFGIEAVASFPVMANVSSLEFTLPPGYETSLSVNVSPSAGVIETSQAGNSLFVLASRYPTQVNYTLDINGEKDIAQGVATVVNSHSTLIEPINLGLLTVNVVSNGNLATTLSVTGSSGVSISSNPVGVNQSASFLLPTGTYTVTGLQANETQSARTSVTDDSADSLTLTFHTIATSSAVSSYEIVEIVLIVAAGVAAVAIAALRVLSSKGLGARMARPAEAP